MDEILVSVSPGAHIERLGVYSLAAQRNVTVGRGRVQRKPQKQKPFIVILDHKDVHDAWCEGTSHRWTTICFLAKRETMEIVRGDSGPPLRGILVFQPKHTEKKHSARGLIKSASCQASEYFPRGRWPAGQRMSLAASCLICNENVKPSVTHFRIKECQLLLRSSSARALFSVFFARVSFALLVPAFFVTQGNPKQSSSHMPRKVGTHACFLLLASKPHDLQSSADLQPSPFDHL